MDKNINKNTLKSTNTWVRFGVVQLEVSSTNFLHTKALLKWTSHFDAESRKEDGTDYEPDSDASLHRHFQDSGLLLKDKNSRRNLDRKAIELRERGMGVADADLLKGGCYNIAHKVCAKNLSHTNF